MGDSSDEDDWGGPKAQIGLQDLLEPRKAPLISKIEVQPPSTEVLPTAEAALERQTVLEAAQQAPPVEEDDELPPLESVELETTLGGGYRETNGTHSVVDLPAPAVSRVRAEVRTEEELVRGAEQDKAEGVGLFQSGQYFKSYQVWRRSIDALEGAESEEGRKMFVALCSNAAQALLKCPEVEGAATEMACSMADKALSVDPGNTRALFRRGCAYANAQGWLLARKDFEQVLRLEPGNEAARRELEKLEEVLPPVAPDVLAKRQEDLPSTATVPKDPAAAVRMAQKEAEKFRREILAVADQKGCVSEWCKKFNKVQVMAADWAKHQLKDPEILQDLLTLRGPLFEAMDAQQREDFLCAYDFVQEVRQRHQDEIDKLFQS